MSSHPINYMVFLFFFLNLSLTLLPEITQKAIGKNCLVIYINQCVFYCSLMSTAHCNVYIDSIYLKVIGQAHPDEIAFVQI